MRITEEEKRVIAIHELREALEKYVNCYVGLYVLHYGTEKADAMIDDPVEGAGIRQARELLDRTQMI